jgi:histidinol-phosphate aminotransferase
MLVRHHAQYTNEMDTIISLDRNENNYGPAPACIEAIATATWDRFSCYSKDYLRGVKSELSERLAADYAVDEKAIMLGYGAEDILKQTVHCYLEKDETILIPTHSWWYYKSIADEKGGVKVEYPMVPAGDRFRYDIDALLELHRRHNARIILISTPNNPTGNSLDFDDLLRILDALKDTVLILDEAYWGFSEKPDGYVKRLLEAYPNLIIIRTFSKLYALAGVRIGFAFLGSGMQKLAQFSARYLGYHRLSELVALAALDSPLYYRDVAYKMLADKERYYTELGALPGITVYRSDANFLLADIDPALKPVLQTGLKARGLAIKFFNEQFLENSVRITIGTQDQNRLLIDAMKEIVGGWQSGG